ncbi:sensor histidine kinase [Sphingomonas sp.]|uniref:sensor histidine kinase n=1 Tax=Sphingomonas sp. TaxID=28214 RepID=UPI001ED676F1|nr:sensor histidine kinase [Sphingomonas sp.]MBX3594875.1 sensor histidine kinase [Sphingomonas sp.]
MTGAPHGSLYWNPGAISYLAELMLALVLSGYLVVRATREIRQGRVHASTFLLTILMLAISLTFLASMLRVLTAGGWVSYAMPWSRTDAWTTLAMPWSRPFGGIVSTSLILLAYHFPKPLRNARTEMRIVGTSLIVLTLVEVAIAVKADLAILTYTAWWRPQWIAGWMNLATVGAAIIFWRQLAVASGAARSASAGHRVFDAIASVWRPAANREARVARAFLILTILPMIHTTALFLPDEGQFGRYPLDIFICWSALAQLVGLTLVLVGYLPERSSFLFKLTIIGLGVLLATVNGLAWIVGPTYAAQFRAPGLPVSGQALRYAPRGGTLGYAMQPTAFLPEPARGQAIGESGGRIDLMFPLQFYGRSYRRLYIDRLGTIGFDHVPQATDAAFGQGVQPAIYPMLVDTANSDARITAFGDAERLIVTRRDRCDADATDRCYQVQTILYADGRIDVQYLDIPAAPPFTLFSPLRAPWIVGITPGVDLRAGPPILMDYHRAFLMYLDRLFAPLVLFTIATALIAAIGLPLLFSNFLVAPLERLLRGIRRFRDGEADTQVAISFNDEIGYLIESFNAMAREQTALTRRLEDRVAERVAEVADMTVRNTKLEERTRLSADLHDAIAQTLASASLHANALPARLRDRSGPDVEAAEQVARLNRHALNEMRLLLTELRSAGEQFSPTNRLTELLDSFTRLHGLAISRDLAEAAPLPPEVFAMFYRVAQECLNNVVKHSGVREVELVFDALEDRALLTVSDQGRGFGAADMGRRERLGLGIMRDRARMIGATLEIDSAPDQGCRVTMIWIR